MLTQLHQFFPALLMSLLALFFTLSSMTSNAQENISITEDGYRIFYSVFNSSFIPPDIASTYKLIRGKDRALVNIVVTKDGEETQTLGLPANLKGEARNLMQQAQKLKFQRINEQNTTYYLAPIRFTNEEVMNFFITVTPEGSDSPIKLKFSKKLYVDRH
ncbi:DUF4426 domain-containing protein [Marinibactrum halimedae]|uniref:DUF4426 domain-containing protein n=1 Tax=Marinibactrum halimedae TaxID=1444977 RepID=A0AA37T795_9GAMM|nr:DUF4426 domain-containing protein [Marinibactrum halimedae]MCD9458312.1 DUF4426 domain-containing protein [Marinibactrum halimedae]GLS27061.1 hypothetical protein GCM10007877_27800 [Marinibactrum halimedae]